MISPSLQSGHFTPVGTGRIERAHGLALGVAGAAEELAEAAEAHLHRLAALLALLVDRSPASAIGDVALGVAREVLGVLALGVAGQARNSPPRPHLITIVSPHLSH